MATQFRISRYWAKEAGIIIDCVPVTWEAKEKKAKAIARLWLVGRIGSCVEIDEFTISGEFVRSVAEYQNHAGKIVKM